MPELYFDNSATTPVDPRVADCLRDCCVSCWGNPASLHKKGIEAERMIRKAAAQIAAVLGCDPDEVLFTSGGTESNNLAVIGGSMPKLRRAKKVITSPTEHPSVLEAVKELEKSGFEAVFCPVDEFGVPDEEGLLALVDEQTAMVSLMLCNNETGGVTPIVSLAERIKVKNPETLIHCDGVQGFCKVPLPPLSRTKIDLFSFSGHKLFAPKGTGGLYVAKGTRLLPRMVGGGQQRGLRSGTEPVPLAVCLGEAVRLAAEERAERLGAVSAVSGRLRALVSEMAGITVNSPAGGAPHILNLSVEGVKSEILLHFLESQGAYVSSGSACAGGKESHVLKAAGLPSKRIGSALRISISHLNTPEEAEQLASLLADGMKKYKGTLR